jgi:energy-coupling factor transporter ATP-binding protein EcfA2
MLKKLLAGLMPKIGTDVTVPCGIDIIDYLNGKIEQNTDGSNKLTVGINSGRFVQIAGPTGVGKTTLAVQLAIGIASYYEGSDVIHADFEKATSETRILSISGGKSRQWIDEHYSIVKNQLYTETLFSLIKDIKHAKLGAQVSSSKSKNNGSYNEENRKDFLVKHPITKETILIPTPIIIDSIAYMQPEDIITGDKMAGNMDPAQVAKKNTAFIKGIVPDVYEAGLIPIMVNHITAKIEINPMVHTKNDLQFLKPEESLPGGKAFMQITDLFLKVTAGPRLKPDEEFGIQGYYVIVELIKSRSNAAGLKGTLVYDQVNGFNNTLTNYVLMKEQGLIGGSGRGYFLTNLPDFKFAQKNILSEYNKGGKFKAAFDDLASKALLKVIPTPKAYFEEIKDEEEPTPPKRIKKIKVKTEDGVITAYQNLDDEKYYLDINCTEEIEIE